VPGDRLAQGARIGARDVHGVANAGASDIDQHAALLRRRPGHGHRVADAIGPLRADVDPPDYAVREDNPATLIGAGGVGADVDRPRYDELAARTSGRKNQFGVG